MSRSRRAWSAVAACLAAYVLVLVVSPEEGTAADVLWLLSMMLIVALVVAGVLAVRATKAGR